MSIPSVYELRDILFDEDACVAYLLQRHVFYEERSCPDCNLMMKLNTKERKFRCPKRGCNNKITLRKNTFFSKSKMPIYKILNIGYMWLKGDSRESIITATGHSSKTITAFLGYYRNLVADMIEENDTKIGGLDIEVELDESKIAKRKYHRGHRVEGAWLVGGVERTLERKFFAVKVPNRNRETLFEVIENHVIPGSKVITDCWKGYSGLQDINNYTHDTVNHSHYFKDPITNVHTNTIEGTWSGLKRKIPERNRTSKQVDLHIFEFIWRRKNTYRLWDALIDSLAEIHYDDD
jgi:transposase-like protein